MAEPQQDELIEEARRRTGLTEFDSDSFVEPLSLLVQGVKLRGRDNPAYRERLREQYIRLLCNRLKIADYLRQHEEIAEVPLDVPVIVMGMPRTGTTLVSHLLDCDPRWRSLLNWEAVDSVPPPTSKTLRTDPRCVERNAMLQQVYDQLPLAPPHWEWADGPTECVFLHAQDFRALSLEAVAAYRPYAEYLLECDMSSAYDFQKKALRVLQSRAPGRWALKMPSHALHFRHAVEAYPDARFIWTHRNPFKALASLGTTISAGHMAGLGEVDRKYIHDIYARQTAEHVMRPALLRASLPDDKILDVYCADFLRDPVAGMREIYAWLGEDFSPEVADTMNAWLARDYERQARRPGYALEDFGWSEAEVAPLFEEYLERYPRAREA